jgi:hypothetical protein
MRKCWLDVVMLSNGAMYKQSAGVASPECLRRHNALSSSRVLVATVFQLLVVRDLHWYCAIVCAV